MIVVPSGLKKTSLAAVTVAIGSHYMKNRVSTLLLAAGLLSLLVNITFYLTYPINIGQSDNLTYLGMIIRGSSNLMHASGYPAILHFLSYPFLPQLFLPGVTDGTQSDITADWFAALQCVQLLFHLTLFSVSIFLCAKVFSKEVAAVLALAWGCNVLFISNVNATAPEWLQGHVLILSLLMHAYARKLAVKKKAFVYCLAAVVFSIAYLIKPNSLLFAVSLFAFLLFDKERWRFKALQLSCSAAIFFLLTSVFAGSYHYKSTGTTQLNFDHAWVLTASLPTDYVSASPERLGLNSLRWAALSRATPPDYFRAGGIENINYGPATDIRERYNKQLQFIFQMSREELIQFVNGNPLPSGYSQWASAVPFYYYYGLEKTDALGIEVYFESLRSHSWYHIQKLGNVLTAFLVTGLKSLQPVPTFEDPIGFKFLSPDFSASLLGKSKIVPPPGTDPYVLPYYNPQETVSFYGVKVIEVFDAFSSAWFVYVLLHIIAIPGLFKLKSDVDKITAFSLLAALMAFVSASAILLGLRQKELITITPVYFLLLSIGLVGTVQWMVRTTAQKREAISQ